MITAESASKLSHMASVLRQHGLASDSIEAIQKANQFVAVKQPEAIMNARPAYERDASNPQAALSLQELQAKMQTFERSKHLLGARVEDLQRTMDFILKRLEQLETGGTARRFAPAAATGVSSPTEGPQAEPAEQAPRRAVEAPQENARSGKYKSQDVDIGKYFYFGKR
ncbi:MAG: hypothetical protein HC945_00025 [Nitrosarchaeum sp.]|nr:hypothetical protein [Nitrosarchaeum sp.]